ncbi:MAG: dephospho-CoA kinase [Candidatus Makaraimicrobium thalassicum]|nr:MAG: dephospho-CoA kinase [Candidatus Omnitrophota bacterium]
MKKKIIIGITGGLATGKTTVADMFAGRGAVKIDADEIAHGLLKEDGEIRRKVIDIFGDDILTDGGIDRRKLAGKVFFDREKMDSLCRVLHPAIIRSVKEQAGRIPERIVVVDAPLLVETRLHDYVDIVVVVTAGEKTQLRRATDRGISEEEAGNIIDKQMPLPEKAKFADYIIDSDMDMRAVKEGVDRIWKKI